MINLRVIDKDNNELEFVFVNMEMCSHFIENWMASTHKDYGFIITRNSEATQKQLRSNGEISIAK